MSIFLIVLQRILFILILMAAGALARKLGVLNDHVQKGLSVLVLDFFWPCMILGSFIKDIAVTDILPNLVLPLLALLTVITGYGLAFVIAKIKGYKGDARKVFLYHGTINNFVFMVLPFLDVLVPEKGAALLFIHNLGIILAMWTLGVFIFKPDSRPGELVRNLFSPGLIATLAGILLVFCGITKYIPGFLTAAFDSMGSAALPVSMLVAGAQTYSLGKGAFKFDSWNILVAVIRLFLVPAILLAVALVLKRCTAISINALYIFMLVNLMPVSLNSVSMAFRYDSDPDLAARGVVFTHLFSVLTITLFLPVIKLVL